MSKNKKDDYSGESIKVLKGLEGIRLRYDMYVGSMETGAFHILKEAIDNCIDEYLNKFGTEVTVEYFSENNMVRVSDNGRGMPIDIHPTEKKPTLELLFTNIHAGGKFDKNSFKVSNGKNGVGIKAINALSSYLKVTSYRSKEFHSPETASGTIEFSRGKVVKEFKKMTNKKNIHGTVIEFIPDEKIFKEFSKLNPKEIEKNLELRTYSNAGLKAIWINDGKKKTYYHKNGIIDYIETLVEKPLCESFYYKFDEETEFGKNEYEVVFQYGNTDKEVIESFVNGLKTNGGTHETGFKMGLTTKMNEYIKENKLLPKDMKNVEAEDIRKGFYCVINIKHTNASYKGQTKDELSNPEVRGLMQKQANINITEWIDRNKAKAKEIAIRIVKFAKGRENLKKSVNKIITQTDNSGLNFSKKFIDCASENPEERRIYLAEGDSAMNNLVYCRDPKFMAIYGLKGKPLNIYKSDAKKIHKNDELNELCVILFGTNDLNKMSIENLRFHHIVIASDADVDGFHIRSLLINDIWRICPEVILGGYVYICLTPKYRTMINNKNVFFQDDQELCDYRYKIINKDINITSGLDLKEILEIEDNFMNLSKEIITKYSVHDDIFDLALGVDKEDCIEILINEKLNYNSKTKIIKGFYDNQWHYFNIDNFYEDINEIYDKFNIDNANIECNISDEFTIYTFIKYIRDNYKLKLHYLKGLGENSPEEFERFMNPNTERLIQIKCNSKEELEERLSIFFGNKPELRKQFILDSLVTNKKGA